MAFKVLTKKQILSNVVVVDNSVMMRWLFNDGSEIDKSYAQKVLHQITKYQLNVIVPYIWVYEASFVVNFYTKKNVISKAKSSKHLKSLFNLCQVIRGEEKPDVLFDFANKEGLSSYDAAYLMLALQQQAPIATLDKKIVKVSKKLGLTIFP